MQKYEYCAVIQTVKIGLSIRRVGCAGRIFFYWNKILQIYIQKADMGINKHFFHSRAV